MQMIKHGYITHSTTNPYKTGTSTIIPTTAINKNSSYDIIEDSLQDTEKTQDSEKHLQHQEYQQQHYKGDNNNDNDEKEYNEEVFDNEDNILMNEMSIKSESSEETERMRELLRDIECFDQMQQNQHQQDQYYQHQQPKLKQNKSDLGINGDIKQANGDLFMKKGYNNYDDNGNFVSISEAKQVGLNKGFNESNEKKIFFGVDVLTNQNGKESKKIEIEQFLKEFKDWKPIQTSNGCIEKLNVNPLDKPEANSRSTSQDKKIKEEDIKANSLNSNDPSNFLARRLDERQDNQILQAGDLRAVDKVGSRRLDEGDSRRVYNGVLIPVEERGSKRKPDEVTFLLQNDLLNKILIYENQISKSNSQFSISGMPLIGQRIDINNEGFWMSKKLKNTIYYLINEQNIKSNNYLIKEIGLERHDKLDKLANLALIDNPSLVKIHKIVVNTNNNDDDFVEMERDSTSGMNGNVYVIMKRYKLTLKSFLTYTDPHNPKELKLLVSVFDDALEKIKDVIMLGYRYINLHVENIFVEEDHVIFSDYYYEDILTESNMIKKIDNKYLHPELRDIIKHANNNGSGNDNEIYDKRSMESQYVLYYQYSMIIIFMDFFCKRVGLNIFDYDKFSLSQGLEVIQNEIHEEFKLKMEQALTMITKALLNKALEKADIDLANDDNIVNRDISINNMEDQCKKSSSSSSGGIVPNQQHNIKNNSIVSNIGMGNNDINKVGIHQRLNNMVMNIERSKLPYQREQQQQPQEQSHHQKKQRNQPQKRGNKSAERIFDLQMLRKSDGLSIILKQLALKKAKESNLATTNEKISIEKYITTNSTGVNGPIKPNNNSSLSFLSKNTQGKMNNCEVVDNNNKKKAIVKESIKKDDIKSMMDRLRDNSKRGGYFEQAQEKKKQKEELAKSRLNPHMMSLMKSESTLSLKAKTEQRSMSKDPRNTSKDQRSMSKDQRSVSKDQRSISKDRRSESKEQSSTELITNRSISNNALRYTSKGRNDLNNDDDIYPRQHAQDIKSFFKADNLKSTIKIGDLVAPSSTSSSSHDLKQRSSKDTILNIMLNKPKSSLNNSKFSRQLTPDHLDPSSVNHDPSHNPNDLRYIPAKDKSRNISHKESYYIKDPTRNIKVNTLITNDTNTTYKGNNTSSTIPDLMKKFSTIANMGTNNQSKDMNCSTSEPEKFKDILNNSGMLSGKSMNKESMAMKNKVGMMNTNSNGKGHNGDMNGMISKGDINKKNLIQNNIDLKVFRMLDLSKIYQGNENIISSQRVLSKKSIQESNSARYPKEIPKLEIIHLDITSNKNMTPYRLIKKSLLLLLTQGKLRLPMANHLLVKDPATKDMYYIINGKNAELVYYGQINTKGQKHGFGRFYTENDEVYYGEFIADLKHGYGTYYYRNNEYYKGEWFRDLRQGEGSLYYPNNKVKLIGIWENDFLNGNGIFYYEDGQVYKGQFKNSKFHGIGKIFYDNGLPAFEGPWCDGLKHGAFRLFDKEGNLLVNTFFENDKEVYNKDYEQEYQEEQEFDDQRLRNFTIRLEEVEMDEEDILESMERSTPKLRYRQSIEISRSCLNAKNESNLNNEGKKNRKCSFEFNDIDYVPKLHRIDFKVIQDNFITFTANIGNFYLNEMKLEHLRSLSNTGYSHEGYDGVDKKTGKISYSPLKDLLYYLSPNHMKIYFHEEGFLRELTNGVYNVTSWNYDAVCHINQKHIGVGFTVFDIYDKILFLLNEGNGYWALVEVNCMYDNKYSIVLYTLNKQTKLKDKIHDIICAYIEYEVEKRCIDEYHQDEKVIQDYMTKIRNSEYAVNYIDIDNEVDVDNSYSDRDGYGYGGISSGIYIMNVVRNIVLAEKTNLIRKSIEDVIRDIQQRLKNYYVI